MSPSESKDGSNIQTPLSDCSSDSPSSSIHHDSSDESEYKGTDDEEGKVYETHYAQSQQSRQPQQKQIKKKDKNTMKRKRESTPSSPSDFNPPFSTEPYQRNKDANVVVAAKQANPSSAAGDKAVKERPTKKMRTWGSRVNLGRARLPLSRPNNTAQEGDAEGAMKNRDG